MDIVTAIGKLCTEYNGHVFGVLLAILGSQVKANKAQAIKNTQVDGKFEKNDLRFTEVEKDVRTAQTDLKEIKKDVRKIEKTTDKISNSIERLEEKERYAEKEIFKAAAK